MEINGNGNMSRDQLIDKIRELSFVKNELALFLDTHAECQTALDYFHKTCEALDDYTERLANMGVPMMQGDVVSDETWTWAKESWPWQKDMGGNRNVGV
ncbi:MAG: spore coat protein CotJB [Clostridia bacterium]|nr:spore coat protein CotJB [Clostridia bacterium]